VFVMCPKRYELKFYILFRRTPDFNWSVTGIIGVFHEIENRRENIQQMINLDTRSSVIIQCRMAPDNFLILEINILYRLVVSRQTYACH
jgi:hypothetical protein